MSYLGYNNMFTIVSSRNITMLLTNINEKENKIEWGRGDFLLLYILFLVSDILLYLSYKLFITNILYRII
jgi:hypothetical protein